MRIGILALAIVVLAGAGGCDAATTTPTPGATVVLRGADGTLVTVPAPPSPPANLGRPKSTPTPATLSAEERARLLTPRPQPSISPTYPAITTPVHPPGASSGNAEVDAVIAALLGGDPDRIRAVVGTRTVGCDGSQAALHPAASICAGKPEGATAAGFAQGYGEWRYYDIEREPVRIGENWKGVYAVLRIERTDGRPAAYAWAQPGDYVAILVLANGVPAFDATLALIEDGGLIGVTPGSAAISASDRGVAKNGSFVLPPPAEAPSSRPSTTATPRP